VNKNRTRIISALGVVFLATTGAFAGEAGQRYIVKFAPGMTAGGDAAVTAAGAQVARRLGPQNAVAAYIPEAALAGLNRNPHIEYIEIDQQRVPMAEVAPYGLAMVQADQLSDEYAATRMVCIIDSGYERSHEDLSGNAVTGTSDNGGAGKWWQDNCGHGTHVGGTLSAVSNSIGVKGVLPNTAINLHIVKVFGDNCAWTYSSELIDALNTCQNQGANVVSMSLGCTGTTCYSPTEKAAFDSADAAGVLSIAAAGNSNNTLYSYPASYDSVVSVAAVDSAMVPVSEFQRNDRVELAAPGWLVRSTRPMGTGLEESVTVGTDPYEARAMEGSPDSSGSGPLADCGLGDSTCDALDKVCLIERGDITFADKVANCEAGGGTGAVIYNNVDGLPWGTLGGAVTNIPSVGISRADGLLLLGRLGDTTTVMTTSGNYGYANGTSMATPHVAGVAALVWSHNPGWTNQEIRDALAATALDLDPPGKDNASGWGLVRAKAAFDCLDSGACEAPNAPPNARFTVDCQTLSCTFDASSSSDIDGTIVGYSWDFGDGEPPAEEMIVTHVYGSSGSYTVQLTVTDNEGAEGNKEQTLTIPTITLTASGHKKKGKHLVDLDWSGATSVDIHRTFNQEPTEVIYVGAPGNGSYHDETGRKGKGSYIYKVCDGSVCSNSRLVKF
jgi:subtilisin family serine protease